MHAFTIADNADPIQVAEYQSRLARLKPACSRCGHTLAKREAEAGQCANREDCRLRRIFAGPKPPGGKALALGEVHAQIRYRKTRTRVVAASDTATPPKSRVELLLDRETAGEDISPDEWRPLNPYTWNPRGVTS